MIGCCETLQYSSRLFATSLLRGLILFVVLLRMTLAGEPEWVPVELPGNSPDKKTGLGSVATVFEIMRHEVTSGQYVEFLRAVASQEDPHGLWVRAMGDHVITDLGQGGIRMDVPQCIYRDGMPGNWSYRVAEGWENRPVIFVTCFSAMRYANWMHNGRGQAGTPQGQTESGAYDMSKRGEVTREIGAGVWIPSDDEWYKAAYFQPEAAGGPPGDYWRFPMSSMERPEKADAGSELTRAAVFSRGFGGILPVGSYPKAKSPWGAQDMGGNVWEWTDTKFNGSKRVMRGGAAAHTWQKLDKAVRSNASPDRWYPDTGFRLARKPLAGKPVQPRTRLDGGRAKVGLTQIEVSP